MRRRLFLAAVISGFSGMVMQILLLRELLTVFHGNDLSIGIILANWLAFEAFGSFFIGKRIESFPKKIKAHVVFSVLFALSSPLALYLARTVRPLFGVLPGVGIGVFTIFNSSAAILFLPAVLHGALFVFSCRLCAQFAGSSSGDGGRGGPVVKGGASFTGKIYVWETIGHIAGAVVFTFFLILHFHSFAIVFGAGILMISASLALAGLKEEGSTFTLKELCLLSGVLLIFIYLLAGEGDDRLHSLSVERQWPDQEVVHHQHSAYGNVAVIERGGEYTFLSDGIPIFTTPTPDIVRVEELVHFSMLSHPQPENIAVLTGGAGGIIYEFIKHPSVKRIDYTEIDPLLLEVVKKFPTALTDAEFADPRVEMIHLDGRRFLQMTPHEYDLIFVGVSNPENLRANRFFTEEFFLVVKERLREEGILVVNLPGSLTYLSHELRNLNAVVINTLKNTFPYLHIIPGYFNIFLASTGEDVTEINAALLYERMLERELDLRLLTLPHIEFRLACRWLAWFLESMQGATTEINRDFRPMGFFYSLAYWNAMFSPYLRNFFVWLEDLSLGSLATWIALFMAVLFLIRLRAGGIQRGSLPFSIATTGFAGMVFDLMLIFTFQVLFGAAFHWIGILIAFFMAGVAAGAFLMTAALNRIKRDLAVFVGLDGAVALFALIFPLLLFALTPYLENPVMFVLIQGVFLVLAFISGMLIGVKFPLANKIYLVRSPDLSKTTGLLYGADLLGGWMGGIFAGVVLLPVLGLAGTSLVVAMVKAGSFIFLISENKGMSFFSQGRA